MNVIKTIPLFGVILVVYMLVAAILYYFDKNSSETNIQSPGTSNQQLLDNKDLKQPEKALQIELFNIPLPSQSKWALKISDVVIIMGLFILFIEVVKSTSIENAAILEHVLSTFVAISYLILFLMAPMAANSTFFILSVMSFVDVVAGITISITQARRDFHVG